MADRDPFWSNATEYDEWFEKHPFVYDAELRAVRSLFVPGGRPTIEVGVGTGRFAGPLGIKIGIDPSPDMARFARRRGIEVVRGIAEDLPFRNSTAGCILMITTICFVPNISKAFQESFRVLEKGGFIIVGMLDRASPVGREYVAQKHANPFYRYATFYTGDEIARMLRRAGLGNLDFRQTLFTPISRTGPNEAVRTGRGEGLFVVVRARKA